MCDRGSPGDGLGRLSLARAPASRHCHGRPSGARTRDGREARAGAGEARRAEPGSGPDPSRVRVCVCESPPRRSCDASPLGAPASAHPRPPPRPRVTDSAYRLGREAVEGRDRAQGPKARVAARSRHRRSRPGRGSDDWRRRSAAPESRARNASDGHPTPPGAWRQESP